jgi:hypothetical protein
MHVLNKYGVFRILCCNISESKVAPSDIKINRTA